MTTFKLLEAETILLTQFPPEEYDAIFAYTVLNGADEATGYMLGVAKEYDSNRYAVYSPGFESAPYIFNKIKASALKGNQSPDVVQSSASGRALKHNLSWDAIHRASNMDSTSHAWTKLIYSAFAESADMSGTMVAAFDPDKDDPVCREILELIFNADPSSRQEALPIITQWIVEQGKVDQYGSHRSQRDKSATKLRALLNSSKSDDLEYSTVIQPATKEAEDIK